MRRAIAVFTFLLLSALVAAPAAGQQYFIRTSTLYVEAVGSGGMVSLNFEKLVADHVGVRIGVGGTFWWFAESLVVPATVSYLVGTKNNFVEIGAGMSFFALPDDFNEQLDDPLYEMDGSQIAAAGILGYRYMGDYGLFMRLAFTPLVTEEGFEPTGGAALGLSW
ncbi:MAG TPA: hypothetical protein PLL30_11525 [Candidatus Krumholzibacteria bacterium]|nr:hypothetical protein [Candidatus Krumholzibacteria bacterium]HPD72395.1 hypothetical protein [Candidatus Krumholzibacteria bacterium]HRY40673.1 hypothetical protein [Candidatus Krumholzibacteria bacterium]